MSDRLPPRDHMPVGKQGTGRANRVVVVGSINLDVVIQCESIPSAGQTVLARSSAEFCGGKGANQAVAASRSGADVMMLGKVGDDAFGERLLANLRHQDVDCRFVHTQPKTASGLAVIAVDQRGQNSIIVVPGANGCLTPDDILAISDQIAGCDIVMLQLEIPLDTVLTTIAIAKQAGVRVILDPAPAISKPPDALFDVDLICPNESEAAALVGHPVETIAQAESAASQLHERGANHVAVTLGERGTLLYCNQRVMLVESYAINAVDTTAAGDAFAGAVASYWSSTEDLEIAIRYANAAGAIAASRPGAQASMATRQEIEQLMTAKDR